MPDDELERRAIDIFLAEFVVESHDRKRSRGFLDGMQFLLLKVQPDSALVSAAKIVVLASIGNRTERNSLRKRAQIQYGQLLQTFTKSLSHKYEAVTIENLFTAVLLGFYEVRTHANHTYNTHSRTRLSSAMQCLPCDTKPTLKVYARS